VTLALVLTLLIGVPLAVPLGNLLLQPQAWQAWTERDRVLSLLQNTAFLIGGTLLLTLPVGIALAALLYRTDLPARSYFRFLIVLTLFIPLPLFASAWQAVLGTGGLLPFSIWNSVRQAEISQGGMVWTPWGQGMGSAIWIHSLAALPWVVLLVGLGLRAVEPELEEDALTVVNSRRVLTRVSLRRASAAIAIATVWIALQVSTEITVTDLMQIRTYAEEVYTQMVAPDPLRGGASGETRALAVTLPVSCLFVAILLTVGTAGAARLSQGLSQSRLSPTFSLGQARWFWFAILVLTTTFYLGLPLLALVWRAGALVGNSRWSARVLALHLQRAVVGEGRLVVTSLITAAITGMLTVSLALLATWCARRCRWFLVSLLLLSAAAWSWPGPVVGLGLKAVLKFLVDHFDSPFLAGLLWHGPSLVPIIWVEIIRFFPFAVAMLWPAYQLMPVDLLEAGQLDGARPSQELLGIVVPLMAGPLVRTMLAVAVLSLGELGASKLVSTPALPSYAGELFSQMHYGVTNDLAARCLLLVLIVAAVGLAFAFQVKASRAGHGPGLPSLTRSGPVPWQPEPTNSPRIR
jgi:iron(III) transport system permease protein